MRRPSVLAAIAEPVRAGGEYTTSIALMPLRSILPSGDGHPVLVLPGFTASDRSTAPMRRVLARLGYEVAGWGLGRNLGPTPAVVDGLPDLLRATRARHGRSVSLVGWSLGGIYARYLARQHPKLVRNVITLGTPVRAAVEQASNAQALYEALRPIHADHGVALDEGAPLEMPATAVHTRTDGIVHWRTCLIEDTATSENLRVTGSHTGLGFNPAAIYVVADRLAQRHAEWAPFLAPLPYRRIITRVPRGV